MLSALSGPVELVGLAAFIPMLTVLASASEATTGTEATLNVPGALQRMSLETAALILGVGVVVRGAFVAFVQVHQLRTGWLVQSGLSTRLLAGLLISDYSRFAVANTDELSSVILSETEAVAGRIVMPYLAIAGALSTAVLLIGALATVEPLLAGIAGLCVAGSYGLTSAVTRIRASDYAEKRTRLNAERFNVVAETLEAYREIRLSNRESSFVEAYRSQADEYGRLMAWSLAIGAAPRYAVETALMLSVVLFVLLASGSGGGAALASLGVFAVAAYRLLPSIQVIYHGVQNIRFGQESLLRIEERMMPRTDAAGRLIERSSPSVTCIGQAIRDHGVVVDEVSFAFPGDDAPVLSDLTLQIAPRKVVGLSGPTGCGKSTLLELIAGLRAPTRGAVRVGRHEVHGLPLPLWAHLCSYVPQRPRLFSGSLAQNITLTNEQPDEDEIARLLEIVCLDDREAMSAIVRIAKGGAIGQDGNQLSGGQRQRIGLARALYQRPTILLLDESTSALDPATERRVITNLRGLGITVLLVAHRESALEQCHDGIEIGTRRRRRRAWEADSEQ